MKVVALIPARGGSKGLFKKNIRKLAGIPLIHYALLVALRSNLIDEVWVSTEDSEIKHVSLDIPTVKVLNRPSELATDTATTESVMLHFAEEVNFDVIVLIQCTSPLLKTKHIDEGVNQVLEGWFDSSFSITAITQFVWKGHGGKQYPIQYRYDTGQRPRRQDLDSTQIYNLETGGFYATTREGLLKSKSRLSGQVGKVEVPFWESFEIDSLEDLKSVEKLMVKV